MAETLFMITDTMMTYDDINDDHELMSGKENTAPGCPCLFCFSWFYVLHSWLGPHLDFRLACSEVLGQMAVA